jgi:hypothetical protein
MTTYPERFSSLLGARNFLRALLDPRLGLPPWVRVQARQRLRHFPSDYDIQRWRDAVLASPESPVPSHEKVWLKTMVLGQPITGGMSYMEALQEELKLDDDLVVSLRQGRTYWNHYYHLRWGRHPLLWKVFYAPWSLAQGIKSWWRARRWKKSAGAPSG